MELLGQTTNKYRIPNCGEDGEDPWRGGLSQAEQSLVRWDGALERREPRGCRRCSEAGRHVVWESYKASVGTGGSLAHPAKGFLYHLKEIQPGSPEAHPTLKREVEEGDTKVGGDLERVVTERWARAGRHKTEGVRRRDDRSAAMDLSG